MFFLKFFVFISLIANVWAKPPKLYSETDVADQVCLNLILQQALVCDAGPKLKKLDMDCMCNLEAGFGSFAPCYVQGYGKEYANHFISTCEEAGFEMSEHEFWQNYTRLLPKRKDVSKIENFNTTELIDFPISFDMKTFRTYRNGLGMYLFNYNYSFYYGAGLLSYWALVILIAAICNWTMRLFPSLTNKFVGPKSNLYRKWVTLSALKNRKKTNEHVTKLSFFSFLIPTRFETIICSIFLALVILASGSQIKSVPGNPQFTNKTGELARLIGDRTGITVNFIVPLLILFAGRNNFLQWVTRWNFATFITYHRWVSRIVILLVIAHAITFSVQDKIALKYDKRMKKPFMIWGTVAGVAGGFILLQGMMFFRRRMYEIFLLIHITLACLFIVGGWYHTDKTGYSHFYWACAAIWAFDRAVRIGRLISFGIPNATLELLARETLKITVPKPKYWKSIPGGHAFIHFIHPTCFWQSHPFTFTTSNESNNYITLYIKIKGGATHSVYQKLVKSPGQICKMRVAVEGPYGEPSGARQYKNVNFIAGGNGIPGIYSECLDLAQRNRDQRLKLIWVIREWKSISWFYQELKYLKNTNIETTIYVTRPDSLSELEQLEKCLVGNENTTEEEELKKDIKDLSGDETNSFDSSVISTIKNELSHITFLEGRPSMEDYVEKEITSSDGTIAFTTCGHPIMVDDIRYYVVNNLDKSPYRVEFFEQLQVWG